jgi:hypothetical protein
VPKGNAIRRHTDLDFIKEEIMITTELTLENLTLNLTQEIHVRASLDATFAALLEQDTTPSDVF